MTRLPDDIRACLFDLDGVVTDTARLHVIAWKETFDAFLAAHADGDAARPFDPDRDYRDHVDGKPRAAGVRDFLASRGIELPEGQPGDAPDAATVHGVARAKNDRLERLIDEEGIDVFEGSVRFIRQVREEGRRTAVVSSSANTEHVLEATGLTDLFDARVDGVVISREGLPGKPAPDSFLFAARALDVAPAQAAVFEDALAGVAAGRAGGFGCTIGVHRNGPVDDLREHGADVVVDDLAELL